MLSVKPHVAVLLAVYNGMRWLEEQLESILNQQGVEVTIFVSVDKSTDGSEDFFRHKLSENHNIILLPTDFKFGGAAKNFFRLIRDVDFSTFDYVSFADQDDIWLSDKLVHAHNTISTQSVSAYSGNVTAFWPDGRIKLIDKSQKQKKYDFLFEAAGPGCSYVLTVLDALRFKHFLLSHWDMANDVALHDWLIYAWFRSNDLKWYIDSSSKIQYRQHQGNQVGANSGVKALLARVSLLRSGWYRQEVSKLICILKKDGLGRCDETRYDVFFSKVFLLRNFYQLRRRQRDQWVLLFAIISGIY